MSENIVCTPKDAYLAELLLRVIDEVERPMLMYDGEKEVVRKGLMLLLDKQPMDRSEQPKRGKWIKDPGGSYSLYKCTVCNDCCTVAGWANCIPEEQMYKTFKFCPNCGAKMEKDENDEA